MKVMFYFLNWLVSKGVFIVLLSITVCPNHFFVIFSIDAIINFYKSRRVWKWRQNKMLEHQSVFFFWPHRIKPAPSAVKARSPNHWTAREFPQSVLSLDSS